MTRFQTTPALTALALVLAMGQPSSAQDQTESYIPQEPMVPLHELIPSEVDEEAAADLDPPPEGPEDGDGDFTDPPALVLPDLDLLPIQPAQGGIAAPDPDAPEPVIPEGWLVRNHFGLSFATPADFVSDQMENGEYGALLVNYGRGDPETLRGFVFVLNILTPENVLEMAEQMRSEVPEADIQEMDTPVQIAGLTLRDTRVTAMIPDSDTPMHLRLLTGVEPLPPGNVLTLMFVHAGVDPETTAETQAALLASFSIPDPALLGLPEPEPFRDGLMTYRILPGWRDSGGISPDFNWIGLGGGYGVPTQARIVLADVGTLDWSMRNFIEDEFRTGPDTISEGMLDGVPVWIFTGQPAFTLSGGTRTTEGDDWRRYSMVTQLCLPDRGPLAVSLITTEDRITSDLTPDAVLAGLRLHLPPEAGPCPTTVTDAVAEAMLDLGLPVAVAPGTSDPQSQPSDGPATPPPPVAVLPDSLPGLVPDAVPPAPAAPPVAEAGKPAAPATVPPPPAPDPEAQAWARIATEPTVDDVYGYLQSWPDGAHAAQARDWLQARGIVPPAPAPMPTDTAREEAQAWARITAEPTVDGIYGYLQSWPDGAHAAQARDWLQARGIVPPAPAPMPTDTAREEAQAWARITTEPTVDGIYGYLQSWPDGAHAAQARDWLQARGIVPPAPAPTRRP